jgi:hypothetical protein
MKFYHRTLAISSIAFLWMLGSYCSLARDSGAIRVRIHSIQANPSSAEIAIVLTDESRQRFLPISVGGDQALAIQLGREGLSAKRPLAHDLLANILKTLNVQVDRMTITDLKEGIYYAEIILLQDGQTHRIDARPSDAIALSVRVNAPIFVMPHLLQRLPERNIKENVPGHTEILSWGVTVQDLTETLAKFFGRENGVLVADVMEESIAAKSGIQAGDVFIRMGEHPVHDIEDFLQSLTAVKEAKSVEIELIRGGQVLTFTINQSE